MADKIANNEMFKKRRLNDSSDVYHDERTVMDSSQHPESQLTNQSDELTAGRSVDLDTVSPVSLSMGKLSCSLLPNQESRAEMFQPVNSSLSREYDTTNTIQGEAVNSKQQPNNEAGFLSSISMQDPGQTIWLLTSESAFTQDELNQALLSACRRGHKLLVQTLVRVGANIEHQDEHGNTPLLICAENGFTDIVRFLVSIHANVKAVNSEGNTSLILSVRSAGSTDMTRFLVEQRDVDIHHENKHGYTALMRAQEALDVDTILILLEKVVRKRPTMFRYMRNIQDKIMNGSSHGLHKVCTLLVQHLHTGTSPLKLAIQERDLPSFQILLDCQFSSGLVKAQYINDAFVYIFRNFKKTQRQTFYSEQIIMIRKLLEYGADVSQSHDMRPLHVAIESGDADLAEILCKHGALKYEYAYEGKHDALMIAVKDGRPDLIEMLLKYGYKADINGYSFAQSPLNCALKHDHTECAKFLIERGAKMDVIGALLTALDHPTSNYINFLLENYAREIMDYLSDTSWEIMDYLSDTSYKWDGLLIAVLQKGSTELVRRILNPGIIVNQPNEPEGSQLMTSATEGVAQIHIHEGSGVSESFLDAPLIQVITSRQCRDSSTIKLARVMVQCGASVNCRSSSGKTPLMIAASKADCADMLEVLIDNSADINETDNEGNTALFHAMAGGYWENPIFLIQVAANKARLINSQNKEGLTPLMVAASQGNNLMTVALLSESADVNLTDSQENSALHHLLLGSNSHSDIILEDLIKAGVDVNHQNNNGLSPLMIAARECMTSAISMLLNAGADVNAVNKLDHASTALSYLPASLYIDINTLSSLEALLDRDASASYLNPVFLHRCIIQKLTVIPKLIQQGLKPTDIESHKLPLGIFRTAALPSVSPLCVALLIGHVSLARYFVDIQFLTPADVSMFASSSILQGLLEKDDLVDSVRFLQELCSQPMFQACLSRVAVSSTLSFFPEREDLVNSLALPHEIQESDNFRDDVEQVLSDVRHHDIDDGDGI